MEMAEERSPAARGSVPRSDAPGTGRRAHAGLERALLAVEERPDALADILEASAEAMVAFGTDRNILHANSGAEKLFGYGRGEIDGICTDQLVPERMRQPNPPPMAPLTDVMQVDVKGLRRDGTELPVEWALGSVVAGGKLVFLMTVRDRAAVDRAIEDLRESEERFRLLVEGVQGYAIFMLDRDGRVSSWNQGAERSSGWAAPEIIGQPYSVFFTPEERKAGIPEKYIAAAAASGRQDVSGWRIRKDSSGFRATAVLTPLRTVDGELRGFAELTRDLTERLEAEDLERRLEAEQRAREAAEDAEQRARASEERLRRLQRVTAALSEAATPADVAQVVLDQTLVAVGADGGAMYVLSADGLALELLDQRGHPRKEMTPYERIPLEKRSPSTDAAQSKVPAYFENRETCAQAYPDLAEPLRIAGFASGASLPLVANGKLLGVLGLRFRREREFDERDRSLMLTLSELCAQALERARLLVAEREARADAESANRSKDEFLAMLGHELRNPLAPIVTALSLMKMRDGDESHKERTVIERQVTHLVRLVDDLLDVSRITRGKVALKRQRIELAQVVANAIELASPLLEQRSHHVSTRVPSEGLLIHADETRMTQVVANLLTNSAKYTQPGGQITITADREGDRVVLSVSDNGMGIPEEMLPRVFDLFAQERQSIDRSQGGLGLGLAIVKSLVGMHDGTVSAESEGRGKGSKFTVALPAAGPAKYPSSADRIAVAKPAATVRRRVLVVDDNLDAAELLAEALRMWGHEPMIAEDGGAALRLALTFRPEVALLDIGLPVMDGYELAPKLRMQCGPLRLIAVTGYGQDVDRQRSKAAGFDVHLVKPVQLGALQAALE